jgi:selenocysteine lyase/cysteine desulfurase
MAKPKGGRGLTAPYQTTHLRVPVPIKEELEKIINQYRQSVLEDQIYLNNNKTKTLEEAKQLARDIIRAKKSAKISLAKLLTSLYNAEILPEDL